MATATKCQWVFDLDVVIPPVAQGGPTVLLLAKVVVTTNRWQYSNRLSQDLGFKDVACYY